MQIFNASQNLIEVELNGTWRTWRRATNSSSPSLPARRRTFATPRNIGCRIFYDSGILQRLGDYDKWDERTDFSPSIVEQIRSKPGQPVLYLPQTSIPSFITAAIC